MKIKNWSKFQHFKDRKPPWVKLYRDLLDDLEWHELDPVAAKVLTMLWLIASEDDGNIPELKTLSFRLRLPLKTTKDCITKLSHWLDQDDINVISNGYQLDSLERETEKETEREKDKEGKAPFGVSNEVWNDFVKHRKAIKTLVTENVINSIDKEAQKAGWTLEQALSEIVARGWRGFKAEWVKDKTLTPAATKKQEFISGLTRGLMGGDKNVKLIDL
jgi:hypothetical protein